MWVRCGCSTGLRSIPYFRKQARVLRGGRWDCQGPVVLGWFMLKTQEIEESHGHGTLGLLSGVREIWYLETPSPPLRSLSPLISLLYTSSTFVQLALLITDTTTSNHTVVHTGLADIL